MNYNKFFNLINYIGKGITEAEFQTLVADKRIFTTTCRMVGLVARKAMPDHDPAAFEEEERTYCGTVVVDPNGDFNAAQQVADGRGWGETIDLSLCGAIPDDHQMINPYEVKNLN